MRDFYVSVVDSVTPRPVYPTDRVPGCLPRKSKPGEWCPMASERIKVIPRNQWADLAEEISLVPHVPTILNQGSVGSCATEASAGGTMIDRQYRGLPFVLLNPWFIYHTTSGGRDRGSSIDENLAFMRENGCAPESVWPRSKGWQATPSEEAVEAAKAFKIEEFFDISSIDEMVSAILLGYPVVYGSNGHATVKVKHIDENKGLDLNSWGDDWGDGGFGVWATYRAVNWAYGAWAVRVSTQR